MLFNPFGFGVGLGRTVPAQAKVLDDAYLHNTFWADRDTGAHNVIQNFAYDYVNRRIYVIHVTSSGPELAVVNRYDMDGPVDQAALDFQYATSDLRHQSFALEKGPPVKLWSSSEANREFLTRFTYNPGGTPTVENYQVGDDSSDDRIWNVAISPSQDRLVAQSDTTVRVYDFQAMLTGGPGDYSGDALYEFTVTTGSQGVAMDDSYVYLTFSTAPLTDPKPTIEVYSHNGTLLRTVTDIDTGRTDAALVGSFNEAEGIAIDEENAGTLIQSFGQGASPSTTRSVGRINRIYRQTARPARTAYVPSADADVEAVFSALTGTPDADYKEAIAQFILQAKAAGLWTLYGALWMTAADVEANALIDWKNPSTNALVKVGSPSFTAYQGFTGNGSNTLLESTLNVSSLTQFTQNDHHLAFMNVAGTDASTSMSDISIGNPATGNCFVRAKHATTEVMSCRSGNTSSVVSPRGVTTGIAHGMLSRTSSGTVEFYSDGRSWLGGSASHTASALPSGKVYLLGRMVTATPTEVSDRTIAYGSVGASMTRVQQAISRNLVVEFVNTVAAL